MAGRPRDISFLVGPKDAGLDPVKAERLLKEYLRSQSTLDDRVRRWITAARPLKPKATLVATVKAYDKRMPIEVDDGGRKLREEVADLRDELVERRDALDEIEAVLQAQVGMAGKGSQALQAAEQCRRIVADGRARLERAVRQVQVPKPAPKPDIKAFCDAASAAIAAGIVCDVIARALKRQTG